MPYCTIADILAEVNTEQVTSMCDDWGIGDFNDPRIQTLLSNIISRESSKIDGRISNIYNVPISPTPPALRDACTVFTCEALYRRRLTPDERNPFKAEADDLRERFKLIGKGELELDLNVPRNFTQGAVVSAPIAVNVSTL